LLCANGIYEMIVDVEQSSFCRVVLAVGRLVRVKELVSREMRVKSRLDNTLNYFRYEGEVRDRTVVREFFLV